jgi:hypothetical protein
MKTKTQVDAAQGADTTNTTQTPELSNLSVAPAQVTDKPKVLTVEDRKGRTEVFTKLLEKHENLKEVQQRVESFAIGSDEHSQTLALKDTKGNSFNTGNPALLKEVVSLIRAQVTAQVGVVETDILNFII